MPIATLIRSNLVQSLTAAMALIAISTTAEAKIPGSVHCYNDICYRIRTVSETVARLGLVDQVVASFYDAPEHDKFNPSTETSSGATFDADAADNAASPIHPDGTVLLVWSPSTHMAAVVRINNAGPYFPGRTLDLSRATAERLGFGNGGTMSLLTAVVAAPSVRDAHYVRGRIYPKVPGPLGHFENIALAGSSEQILQLSQFLPAAQRALATVETGYHLRSLALAFNTVPAESILPSALALDAVPDAS